MRVEGTHRRRPQPAIVVNPGGGRAIAAKLGLCAGLFAFLLSYYARIAKVQLSPRGHLIVMVACTLMILAGLVLAAGALVANRRGRRPGVVGFAIAALVVNGFLAASLIYSIVRVS